MNNISFPKLGIHLTINPIAFSIGNLDIYWYGIILAVGFIAAYVYVLFNSKRFGLDSNKVTDCVIIGIITGIIGARLYYVLFYPSDFYRNNPINILYINQGGIAIYGGILGGLLGGLITAKIKKIDILAAIDIAAVGLLIGQSIGRWGNFVNQEAFGIGTTLPWGMISENTLKQTSMPVHPCFLYESLWCLIGFVVLDIFSRKHQKYKGQLFLLYIVWYGIERFIVESLRTDSLIISSLGLRVSQVVALASVILGTVLLIVFRNREDCDYY